MPLPAITEDQREMAVALLANALRKQEERRQESGIGSDHAFPEVGSRRAQRAADARYVQGMRDLLTVLFAGGRATTESCLAQARAQALGGPPGPT